MSQLVGDYSDETGFVRNGVDTIFGPVTDVQPAEPALSHISTKFSVALIAPAPFRLAMPLPLSARLFKCTSTDPLRSGPRYRPTHAHKYSA